MKKFIVILLLYVNNIDAQIIKPSVIHDGPDCALYKFGENKVDYIYNFKDFISNFGIDSFNINNIEKIFIYSTPNINVNYSYRMFTFNDIDISVFNNLATKTINQTFLYEKFLNKNFPNDFYYTKNTIYDSIFYDNFESLVINEIKDNKYKLLNNKEFIDDINKFIIDDKLVLFDEYNHSYQIIDDKKNFNFDVNKVGIEQQWWYDYNTNQFENVITSIKLNTYDTTGNIKQKYLYYPNYFFLSYKYTSLNGVCIPINYAFNENLIPLNICELYPDSFYLYDELNTDEFKNNNIELFLSEFQISEFILYQRRVSIFGRNFDTLSEKRFKYEISNNMIQNTVIKYYKNGQILYKTEFKDNKTNGLYECYYPNGKLYEIGNFKNGKKNGVWKTYYETGLLKCERNYNNGHIDGKYISYYSNGNKNEIYFFRQNGSKSVERYYSDGIMMEKGELNINNQAEGLWEYNLKFTDDFSLTLTLFELWENKCSFWNINATMDENTKSVKFKIFYELNLIDEVYDETNKFLKIKYHYDVKIK